MDGALRAFNLAAAGLERSIHARKCSFVHLDPQFTWWFHWHFRLRHISLLIGLEDLAKAFQTGKLQVGVPRVKPTQSTSSEDQRSCCIIKLYLNLTCDPETATDTLQNVCQRVEPAERCEWPV
jgi:hypothetical protein